MKKLIAVLLSALLLVCLVACDNGEVPSGGGKTEITGSLAYFFDGVEEEAIETFYSEDKENKSIALSKEGAYTIRLRPSFRGSKAAMYSGDCATFSYPDGCCEITFIGEESNTLYELKINVHYDFDLTITVDGYVQTIKIIAG